MKLPDELLAGVEVPRDADGRAAVVLPAASFGDVEVALRGTEARLARLEVRSHDAPDRVVFATVPGQAFVAAASTQTTWEVTPSHVTFDEQVQRRLPDQRITDVDIEPVAASGAAAPDTDAGPGHLEVTLDLVDHGPPDAAALDRSLVRLAADLDTAVLGLGAQPLTFAADLTAGVGGDWSWTYPAVPLAIRTDATALIVEDTEVARIDLTVRVAAAQQAGVPLAAGWLQDWVGQRTTSFGDRLWWSLTLDTKRYPGWDALVDDLAAETIRVLTYTNPFLAVDAPPGVTRRDLYGEVRLDGYLVTDPDGQSYAQDQGEFDAVLHDSDAAVAQRLAGAVGRAQPSGARACRARG